MAPDKQALVPHAVLLLIYEKSGKVQLWFLSRRIDEVFYGDTYFYIFCWQVPFSGFYWKVRIVTTFLAILINLTKHIRTPTTFLCIYGFCLRIIHADERSSHTHFQHFFGIYFGNFGFSGNLKSEHLQVSLSVHVTCVLQFSLFYLFLNDNFRLSMAAI